MQVDFPNFLISLAKAMIANDAAYNPGLPALTPAKDLFVNLGVETPAGADPLIAPYGVIRCYGGPSPDELLTPQRVSIQAMVTGANRSLGLRLAWRLYNALRDEDGLPLAQCDIAGYKLAPDGLSVVSDADVNYDVHQVIFAGPPGQIGVDERGVASTTFNFDVRFEAFSS